MAGPPGPPGPPGIGGPAFSVATIPASERVNPLMFTGSNNLGSIIVFDISIGQIGSAFPIPGNTFTAPSDGFYTFNVIFNYLTIGNQQLEIVLFTPNFTLPTGNIGTVFENVNTGSEIVRSLNFSTSLPLKSGNMVGVNLQYSSHDPNSILTGETVFFSGYRVA
jgi:hypothetical protein